MRYRYIDNAKALTMILVALGHTPGLPSGVHQFIYSFHMPLFFFLSGCVLTPRRLTQPLVATLRYLFKTLIIPYLLFFILSWIYWVASRNMGTLADKYRDMHWLSPLSSVFWGTRPALIVNVVLWFFPCLFLTRLYYYLARKVMGALPAFFGFALVGILVAVLCGLTKVRLPWSGEIALTASFFYAAGYTYHSRLHNYLAAVSAPLRVAIAVVFALVAAVSAFANGEIDFSTMGTGGNVPLFFLSAFSGLLFITVLSSVIAPLALLRWISDNAIVLFPLHNILYGVFTGIGVLIFGLPHTFKETPFYSLVYVTAAFLCCIPVLPFLRFALPFAFRKPANSAGAITV